MKNRFFNFLKRLFCKHEVEARYLYLVDTKLPYKIMCKKCDHVESIL